MNEASINYLLDTFDPEDKYFEFGLKAERNTHLQGFVEGRKVVYEEPTLIYAPCDTPTELDEPATRACFDAVQTAAQVEWYFVPYLMPKWVSARLVKADKVVGWYKGDVIFSGDCKGCYYRISSISRRFKEYSAGNTVDAYWSRIDENDFRDFESKTLWAYQASVNESAYK